MRHIKLSQGKVARVSPADFEALNKYTWHCYKSTNGKYYAARNNPRKHKDGKYLIKMHRQVLGLKKHDKKTVDHINGDTLDNRRSNLRVATNQQNCFNRGPQSNNSSGYKGVYKHSQYDKWVAQIKKGDTRVHLGVYSTAQDAARAYDRAAIELHGEHGRLNFESR